MSSYDNHQALAGLTLGKSTDYRDTYDASLLQGVPRSLNRDPLGLHADNLPFHGADIWTLYELSWLNGKGLPQVAVFGSTSPEHTPPLNARAEVIWLRDELRLDCAPCFQRVCPLGHTRCLAEVAPPRVETALLQRVAAAVDVRYYKAGESIVEFGQVAESWHVVRSGAVEVFRRNGALYNRLTAGGYFSEFDGIMAMYYDQATVPFHALYNEDGVLYTAGLPLIHTAANTTPCYFMAGCNEADPTSFRHAIFTALDAFRHRETSDEVGTNPLPKLSRRCPVTKIVFLPLCKKGYSASNSWRCLSFCCTRSRIEISASITVLPVTTICDAGIFSRSKFCCDVSVGAKW